MLEELAVDDTLLDPEVDAELLSAELDASEELTATPSLELVLVVTLVVPDVVGPTVGVLEPLPPAPPLGGDSRPDVAAQG